MNKLSKRAISILVIVTFLMSMISIMPAIAADIPANRFSIEATAGTAQVSTAQASSGTYSAHLITGIPAGDESRIVITMPPGFTLGDLDTISWKAWTVAGYPAHVDIILGDDIDGILNIDSLTAETNQIGDSWISGSQTYGSWLDTFEYSVGSRVAEIDTTNTIIWVTRLGAGPGDAPHATLADWRTSTYTSLDIGDPTITIDADTVILRLEIEIDNWILDTEVYIDDITINGDVFSFESYGFITVVEGDTLELTGGGVTSGSLVKAFWDAAIGSGAQLLNTTEANPDGSWDVEIDVPSDVEGLHYLWVETADETGMVEAVYMIPSLGLSPSSGLEGDEVTVTGYGFTAESDVTIDWDLTELTDSVETDEDGYFTYTFDVTETAYDDYAIVASDSNGASATEDFTVGASFTLDIEVGPEGTVVEITATGFEALQAISATDVDILDSEGSYIQDLVQVDDPVTADSDGDFTLEVVIPSLGTGEYILMIVDTTGGDTDVEADFEVDGVATISVDPTYGSPGAVITITGSNFTQIDDTDVVLELWTVSGDIESVADLGTVQTDSDGSFTDTFVSPAVAFTSYEVRAVEAVYDLAADDAFKVGLIALIVNPVSGEAGTEIAITGIGFAEGTYNLTFGAEDVEEGYGDVNAGEAISDNYYIPNVEPGVYTLTIIDVDENELAVIFTVTESTTASVDPVVAPTGYNVTLSGNNFADDSSEVDFVIYNSTDDWPMIVQTTISEPEYPTLIDTITDDDGNFTGWWLVDADLSNGDYTINVTGGQGLLVQLDFSVVAARVSVAPRKALFDRGNTVSFDISNDFALGGSYIEIFSPDDTLYWITEDFNIANNGDPSVWVLVDELYTVPYYRQTANMNEMELASDAPLGTWTYFFYDNTDDELMNGTFAVGPSTGAQVDALLEDVRDDISSLASDLAGITDDLEDDVAALSSEIGGIVSDMGDLRDDIVGDLANDIAAATDAGQSALDAVEDLADSMTDLGDAVGDIADIAVDAADAAQYAADAADDAVTAAENAGNAAQGLTTLVYGAIGASLIAALAAIVSLMQISKKIAG